jgi:hypothetical protein
MLKRSLFFGSAVLFLAALITLTGCPTEADDDGSGGGTSIFSIHGTIRAGELQGVVERAIAEGQTIILNPGLEIYQGVSGETAIDFKTASVRITGWVTTKAAVVINMALANVIWGPDGYVDLARGFYIYNRDQDIKRVSIANNPDKNYSLVPLVPDNLQEIPADAQRIAVRNYTLHDVFDIIVNQTHLESDLVVLEKLTVTAAGDVDDSGTKPRLYAMGKVDVTQSNNKLFMRSKFSLLSTSTVTNSGGNEVSINLAPNFPTPVWNVSVESGKDIVILGAATAGLKVGNVTGGGTLHIGGTAFAGPVVIWNTTGHIAFSDPVALSKGSVITGVTFNKGLVVGTGAGNDNVRVGNITLPVDSTGAVAITFTAVTDRLSLLPGTAIYVGSDKVLENTSPLYTDPRSLDAVISVDTTVAVANVSKAQIRGSANKTLEFSKATTAFTTTDTPGTSIGFAIRAGRTIATPPALNAVLVDGPALGAAPEATLQVAEGTTLSIRGGTLDLSPGAVLTLSPDAVLSLGGSVSVDNYSVDGAILRLGAGIDINGPVKKVPGTLKASESAVALGGSAITGEKPGATLVVGGDIIPASAEDLYTINIFDPDNAGAAPVSTLTLDQVNLDLTVGAGLSFGGGFVALDNAAKIILNTGTGVEPDGIRLIDPRSSEAYFGYDPAGGVPEYLGVTAAAKAQIVSIAHKIGGAVTISGTSQNPTGAGALPDIVLRKGDTLVDPAKITQ